MIHSFLLSIYIKVTKQDVAIDSAELGRIKRKISELVSARMKLHHLDRTPTQHSSMDLTVSHIFLGQFVDDIHNKNAMYPPISTPGIDAWFAFIKDHFRICKVEQTAEEQCCAPEVMWQMKKPFHSMCRGFPLFACGRLTWLSLSDAVDSELAGFVQIRQGSTDPGNKDPNLAMNVYIDTNIRHANLPSNDEEMVPSAICPNMDLPEQKIGTPRWHFQSNARACYGMFHYSPGKEMGTTFYPMAMYNSDGQLPPTRLTPQGSEGYPNPSVPVAGRQRASVSGGYIASSGCVSAAPSAASSGGGAAAGGSPAPYGAVSTRRRVASSGGGRAGTGPVVGGDAIAVAGGGDVEGVEDGILKRPRTKITPSAYTPVDFRSKTRVQSAKVRLSSLF